MTKKDRDGNVWQLKTSTGKLAEVDKIYEDSRGERHILKDGDPPHKQESSGYVYVINEDDGDDEDPTEDRYYPSVLGMKWEKTGHILPDKD